MTMIRTLARLVAPCATAAMIAVGSYAYGHETAQPAVVAVQPASTCAPAPAQPAQPAAAAPAGLVNLNTASQAELEALPGIGTKTAQRIIAARPLASVDAAGALPGVAPRFAQWKGLVTV